MANFHTASWTVPATAQYIAVCGAGGGSGLRGQATPYRGPGGGGGATSSKIFSEVAADIIPLQIPDNGTHGVLEEGAQAVYAFGRGLNCTAAGGKFPSFFGPVGLGGTVAACIGDVKTAGADGSGPVPDFTVGAGHNGGSSADGTPGATGGGANDASGGQDGIAPGGGGGGGGSMGAGNNQHSACSGGYVLIYRAVDWPGYPSGSPTTTPIAIFGTAPVLPTFGRAYAFIM